jgi:flagellar hook-associated protein 1 FlgK
MSLTQALTSAAAGMRTTQAGLSLVAGNVSNADTPGYVRKTVSRQATGSGDFSIGVRTDGVNRELDVYVQRQLRAEASGGAYADLKAQFYDRLQNIYGTPGSASSIESLYSDFTTALQALTASPADYSARAGVIGSAQALAQQINGLSNQIQSLRADAELGIADAVRSANDSMTRIAQINQELAAHGTNDAASANLRDQRDTYIDKLGQLMDIRTSEGSTGEISVFTNSGFQLVGAKAAKLNFDAQGTVTASSEWSANPAQRGVGTITLSVGTGSGADLITNNAVRSGQLAAYIEMRDKILPQAQAQVDELAAGLSRALSDATRAGTAATGVAPQAGFDVDVAGLQAGNTIKFNFTDTATGKVHDVTLVRVDDPSALPLPGSATPNPNDEVVGVDWSGGLSSALTQLNALYGGRIQFSNPSGSVLRILDDGAANTADINAASATVTATSLLSGSSELPFFLDGTVPYSGAISGSGSQTVGYAGRITVNPALVADPSRLVVYQANTPSGEVTRPSFIYDQLTKTSLTFSARTGLGTPASPFSSSLPIYLRQVMSQQGDAAQSASHLKEGQNLVVSALQQRLDETSGVNIDQEMSNLVTLQTAYSANARVLTAVKEIMDLLLRI